jgi:hypothetical protein
VPQQYERARPLIGSHVPVPGKAGGLAYAEMAGAPSTASALARPAPPTVVAGGSTPVTGAPTQATGSRLP